MALSGTGQFRPDNSAKSISQNHVSGINRLVGLSIVIEGRSVPFFKHFSLEQHAGGHHCFRLVLAHDTLGGAEDHNLESANGFLGRRITVVLRYRGTPESPERAFVGVVTGVGYSQEGGGLGNIVLTGYSPTILLDGAPHTQSFGGGQAVNMGIIAREVLEQGLGTQRFDVRVDAADFSQIPYYTQHNETHYNYFCRMADAYGEQFYYDGEVVHFGKMPPQNDPVQLIYGSNVSDIRVEINAIHTKPEFYGYNSSRDAKLTSGATPVEHKGDLAKTAYSHNINIFKTKSLQAAPIRAQTDLDVENSQRSAAGSAGVEVFTVWGSTSIPFLYPGCVCDLEMRKPDSSRTSYFTRGHGDGCLARSGRGGALPGHL